MPVLENPKHERFALEIAKGKSLTDAYELAGYKRNPSNSARFNNNQAIQARIAELQGIAAEDHAVTVQSLAAQLADDRQFARSVKQGAPAVKATELTGKLFGLLTDKVEHTGSISLKLSLDAKRERALALSGQLAIEAPKPQSVE